MTLPDLGPKPTLPAERRGGERQQLVFRLGVLESETGESFCLLKNISSSGVQIKVYAPVREGWSIRLRVGDENPLDGRVAWVRDGNAGIAFEQRLDAGLLLRVKQALSSRRRRSLPRISAIAPATLRTGGKDYVADLQDISTSGARIRTRRSVQSDGKAVLVLRDLPPVRAYVRWVDGLDSGLVFETPIPVQLIVRWLGGKSATRAA